MRTVGDYQRSGTVATASAHIITTVIGSGVLSLSWSTAQLGWIFGMAAILGFGYVTYALSEVLIYCYRSPDFITGKRNTTYKECVKSILGGQQEWWCAFSQHSTLAGTCIGYIITAANSMSAIKELECTRHGRVPCTLDTTKFVLIFGASQLVFSQIPDIHSMWWLSYVAAIMAFSYSGIGLGLSFNDAAVHKKIQGNALPAPDKTWGALQAIGNIAFAYSFSNVLVEIQDTVKPERGEDVTMHKANTIGMFVTTLIYMAVGGAGYAAFGRSAPGDLLMGFRHSKSYWLVHIANVSIIVHLVGGYQVLAQPVFGMCQGLASKKWPKSRFVNGVYEIMGMKVSVFRLLWRSLFVIFTTLVALVIPFFNAVNGFLGAVTFWPLTVYFPVAMYTRQYQVKASSPKGIALWSLSLICLVVSVACAVGSVQGIVSSVKDSKPFHL